MLNNPLLIEAIGVHFPNMDVGVHEQVVYNEDGSFAILTNSRIGSVAEKHDVDAIETFAHSKNV